MGISDVVNNLLLYPTFI